MNRVGPASAPPPARPAGRNELALGPPAPLGGQHRPAARGQRPPPPVRRHPPRSAHRLRGEPASELKQALRAGGARQNDLYGPGSPQGFKQRKPLRTAVNVRQPAYEAMTQRDGWAASLRCSGWRWAWSPVQIVLLWPALLAVVAFRVHLVQPQVSQHLVDLP